MRAQLESVKGDSMKRFVLVILLLGALAGGGIAYQSLRLGASESKAQQPSLRNRPVPVVVAPVERKDAPVRLEAIGTVQPLATVVVKSRIDGQIVKVHFKDGQDVKAGDTLFTLDSRAVEAQLRQAEAVLVRDRAQLANAKREVERQGELAAKNFASNQKLDEVKTTAAALEATVRADEAAVENLKVQISYCTITTPIDGRAGAVALKTGNNVKAVDTITLVTINQIHPIYVSFPVPQLALPEIRDGMKAGPLEVRVTPLGNAELHERGTLAFVDNQIDVATGTIALKAVFTNPRDTLWPGQFVSTRLTLRVEPNQIVVPPAAVQIGQNGNYVYVIKPDLTAEARQVQVARTVAEWTVITDGLKEGEQVVTDGALRLTTGTKVELRTPEAAKPSPTS
jgi:multidrug efflux system membrane fusion protein